MKKITFILSSILFSLSSYAQTPQQVPGDYQVSYTSPYSAGALGECAALGSLMIFVSNNTLWRTDGSLNGTFLIKEFTQDDSLKPIGLKEYNSKLYFFADDGVHGYELWSTDGTTAGTTLVKDIDPGSAGSIAIEYMAGGDAIRKHTIEVFNDRIYFAANDGVHGRELWKSDGTEQGTEMFGDLNPGSANGLFSPRQILAAGNKLYFIVPTPSQTVRLYATDGTVSGMTLCLDTFASLINETMVPYGNKIIFSVGINMSRTYISDGTEAGTFIIVPGKQTPKEIAILNNKAYFFAGNSTVGYGYNLMVTDGTLAGTQIVDSIFGGLQNYETMRTTFLQKFGNKLFFLANHLGSIGLWSSDGTPTGTALIKETEPYTGPYHLMPFNGKLYFKASNNIRHDLWYSDGTEPGTGMISMPGTVTNDGHSHARKYYRYPMVSTGSALYFYNKYEDAERVRIYKLDQFPANVSSSQEVSSIDIYPSPSQGFITIDAEQAKTISIHSIDGKLVYQNEQPNANKHTVDTHNFAAGTYSITTLLSDGTKRYGKFVKQ